MGYRLVLKPCNISRCLSKRTSTNRKYIYTYIMYHSIVEREIAANTQHCGSDGVYACPFFSFARAHVVEAGNIGTFGQVARYAFMVSQMV